MIRKIAQTLGLFVALLLAIGGTGCATDSATPQAGEDSVRFGRIVQIDPAELRGDHQLGVGAIIGSAAGGLLGSFVGQGTGRDIAMVAGAVGGGVVGNTEQNRYVDTRAGQHVTVQLRSSVAVAVTQPENANLRVGDRVRIDGSGQRAGVVRA